MWEFLELTVLLVLELAGEFMFGRLADKALGWLKIW